MQEALNRTLAVYREFPGAFPAAHNLHPADFERWSVQTPERWVDPRTLQTNDKGQVKIGGERIMLWRYFTVVWALLTESSSSASSSSSPGQITGSE